ncbi:MAG: aminoacyl-tRNA hydrolase [Gaiella sp.]
MRLFRRGDEASTLDLLIVGLGNPGPFHAADRHNVGWMVVDELARRHGATFRSKFNGRLADVRVVGARVALLAPETFMNESGRSVQPAVRFYKTPLDRLLVVHDEVDLETGRLQAKLGGGLAGHNGLRSIAGRLGSPDFLRLRVGVGRPERGDRRPVADYVLSPFEADDEREAIVSRAADAVECLLAEGLEETQRRHH